MTKPARKRRDADFSSAEVEKLRRFAGAKCSSPACGVETDAKRSDADGILNMGIAAHVYGAQPGAARYRRDQPPEERRSALKNGIWLCMPCSKLVDTEWGHHPAERLFQWRREREHKQHEWVVKRLTLTDNPRRELGASTIALLAFAFLAVYVFGSGWMTLTFSASGAVSYTLFLYYDARHAELATQLRFLSTGSTAMAAGGAVSWTWKRLLATFTPAIMLIAAIGLGVGWSPSTAARASRHPDESSETVDIANEPSTSPAPPAPPPSEALGAPGPPQQIRFMSDDTEDDPVDYLGVLDGVNQEIVGDPGPPKRIWVAQIQPTRDPGFAGELILRNLELHALRDGTSVIGGTSPTSKREPAPVLIEDSIIDPRIRLGPNVRKQNVRDL